MVRIRTLGECLRLELKSRVSRCLPSPRSGGSVEGGLEQRFRFRIQCLVYSYLTKWKEILFLSLEACQRPLSLIASALLAHRPKGRQSMCDPPFTSWFHQQRFVEPWQWPRLKTFVRFWWRWLEEMVCQNLIFFIVKWKHSNPFQQNIAVFIKIHREFWIESKIFREFKTRQRQQDLHIGLIG